MPDDRSRRPRREPGSPARVPASARAASRWEQQRRPQARRGAKPGGTKPAGAKSGRPGGGKPAGRAGGPAIASHPARGRRGEHGPRCAGRAQAVVHRPAAGSGDVPMSSRVAPRVPNRAPRPSAAPPRCAPGGRRANPSTRASSARRSSSARPSNGSTKGRSGPRRRRRRRGRRAHVPAARPLSIRRCWPSSRSRPRIEAVPIASRNA